MKFNFRFDFFRAWKWLRPFSTKLTGNKALKKREMRYCLAWMPESRCIATIYGSLWLTKWRKKLATSFIEMSLCCLDELERVRYQQDTFEFHIENFWFPWYFLIQEAGRIYWNWIGFVSFYYVQKYLSS